MILLRALGAFVILFFVSVFVFANAKELTSGVGYNFLLIALGAFAIIFFLGGDIFNLHKVQFSTIALIIFVAYFGTKFYLESNDYEETKQFLTGTSNGIVFAIFLGFMSSYAMTVIYEMRRTIHLSQIAFALVTLYLAYMLFLAYGTFQFHGEQQQEDLFLITNQEGHYQRTGDFLLMQFVLAGSLFILILTTAGRFRFFTCLPIFLLLMAITALFGLTAQLVGSNSGLIGPVSFMFVIAVLYVVISLEGTAGNSRKNKLSSLIFGGLKFKLLFGSIVSAGLLVAGGMLVLQFAGVDVDVLRVTGYGVGENISIVSRNEIFKENFIPHFAYSPIFGHTHVEKLAGDGVARVHSLASILTHLGLVGFLVFFLMLIFLYQQIISGRNTAYDSLFSNQQYGLYRLFAILSLLAMCSVSQFFAWMPMWFAFGMFGEWIYRANRIKSSKTGPKRRSRRRRRRPLVSHNAVKSRT